MQSNQCLECSRLGGSKNGGFGFVCEAFPSGIPDEIITGETDHTEPVDGDHGIQFKKREE